MTTQERKRFQELKALQAKGYLETAEQNAELCALEAKHKAWPQNYPMSEQIKKLTAQVVEIETKAARLNHNAVCTMAFGRPTKEQGVCPRCDELRTGAKPRPGWGDAKRRFEAQASAAIRSHNCATAGCGPVCTFGEW